MIEEKDTGTQIQDQTSEQYGTNESISPILVRREQDMSCLASKVYVSNEKL